MGRSANSIIDVSWFIRKTNRVFKTYLIILLRVKTPESLFQNLLSKWDLGDLGLATNEIIFNPPNYDISHVHGRFAAAFSLG